jgi:hypothetical protein
LLVLGFQPIQGGKQELASATGSFFDSECRTALMLLAGTKKGFPREAFLLCSAPGGV